MDEHVLLVEDDASIREITTLGLEQAGFRVTTSGDGREGLLQFRQGPFDLVVLDVMLPTLDGFTVKRGGEEIALTATEFRLLLELARRPKQVFTRELLLELVWNYDYLGDSRLVDAAVQRLRAKIEADPKEPKLIRTVRGVGYRFDAN